MTMDSPFTMLKKAREAKNLSLADVADSTFISIRYLEAIEAGKTDILPQAYIRAFIREYAAVVGLDTAEVMRRLDNPGAPVQSAPPPRPAPGGTAPPPPDVPSSPVREEPLPAPPVTEQLPAEPGPSSEVSLSEQQPGTETATAPAPRRDLTDVIQKAAVVMGVVVIAVVLWNVMGIEKPKTQETPFQNVIRENELHASGQGKKDTTRLPAVQGSRTDSLTLQAQTTDSVWVQVSIDGGPPREYLFRPNSRATWKAGERFLLTIGNASAVQLTLNKKDLGVLGKKGAVIQKLELTRHSLSR
jgi:hypothetical protein